MLIYMHFLIKMSKKICYFNCLMESLSEVKLLPFFPFKAMLFSRYILISLLAVFLPMTDAGQGDLSDFVVEFCAIEPFI